jgi:trypsin-like peptidase
MATHEWTAEEAIAELRRRERGGGQRPERSVGEPEGVVPRFRDIGELSSAELARLAQDRQRVVYGVDNRKDMYEVTDKKTRRAADAVVALVKTSDLRRNGAATWSLQTTRYQDDYTLCPSEPFAAQPLGCFCSGFLVRPDVIATAGHCVKSPADLAHTRFVFGFRMIDAATPRTTFGDNDVYEGAELVGREFTSGATDWALVRLTRAVVGRTPVTIRTAGRIAAKQALFVIGHPCGLPQKFADQAAVRDNGPKAFFVANLDTYGGNSGSPVFNADKHSVEGILVRGENDFVKSGTCYVSLVCPTTGCRGEDVTRSTEWAAKLKGTKATKARRAHAAKRKK